MGTKSKPLYRLWFLYRSAALSGFPCKPHSHKCFFPVWIPEVSHVSLSIKIKANILNEFFMFAVEPTPQCFFSNEGKQKFFSAFTRVRIQSSISRHAGLRISVKLSVGVYMHLATGWTTGRSWFDLRKRQEDFPLISVSRLPMGPTQPSIQWVLGVLSPGVKCGRGIMLTTHPHLVPR
jgi:hypothetical protein